MARFGLAGAAATLACLALRASLSSIRDKVTDDARAGVLDDNACSMAFVLGQRALLLDRKALPS
ncbi:hypothetical protein LHP98_10495 [Rhodobacter sp. Har01]|uniref:hypothetical protein n=1 Tax=Rhodobacter sp. Har01 TaxID=2883999 RepID=UPI001D0729CA|nr:hypothetical protein [Rhodobacter sp. Har01]MCB6178559.1 hypothetical protein [Rhodobacter sp. Har01]